MSKNLFKLLLVVAGWRLALFAIGGVAGNVLPYQPSFPYAFTLLPSSNLPQWLYSWANFDGVHYLTIVTKGYVGTGLIQAFFPGYPMLVSLFDYLFHQAIISGLLVSNLLLIGLSLLWLTLLKLEKLPPWLGLAVLLMFPTSFFLGALYSESLFLVLVLGSFLAARRQTWWLAALLAGLASATRIVGIFLVPALIIEYLDQQRQGQPWPTVLRRLSRPDLIRLTLMAVLGSLGLLGYMLYLQTEFQDPLYFLHVQSEFGAGRSESLILYPQVVWRALKILATYQAWDWRYLAYVQEFVVGTLGLVALAVAFKYVRLSYVVFSLAVFLLPTLTGTFSSMPRYVLASFAVWLLLTKLLHSHRWLTVVYLVLSTVLLVVNTILFIQGYWVA